jgi:hypothetical protein
MRRHIRRRIRSELMLPDDQSEEVTTEFLTTMNKTGYSVSNLEFSCIHPRSQFIDRSCEVVTDDSTDNTGAFNSLPCNESNIVSSDDGYGSSEMGSYSQ